MERCIILSIEEFEKKLNKATNGNVCLIFEDGWTYGATEEWGDVNDDELYKLIGKDLDVEIDRIRIDIEYEEVFIVTK